MMRAAGGAARHRPGPPAPPAKGHAHAMTGAQAPRGRRRYRVRRRRAAPRRRRRDRGRRYRRPGAAARSAAGHSGARDAAGGMAGPGLYRCAGQWRRRRAVQRSSDPGRHRRDRRRASPLRHDRAAADPDQRHAREDAPRRARRSQRRCALCPGVLGIHFEGPFLSPERAGRARSGDVPRAGRCGSGAADRAARRRDAGDAGAGMRAVRLYRERWQEPACGSRSGIRWRATNRRAPRWPRG